jgi:hypothetical protein
MERKFVFETDWFTDCDDLVALRFLTRNLDEDHKLLGVNINACTPYVYASMCAFLKNDGVDCPVGLDLQGDYPQETVYQKPMAKGVNPTNDGAQDSLAFYKKILEENDDVEIISVGFLSALQRVFTTYPALIKKVKKLWIMGGNWEKQGGAEYNFRDGNHPALAIKGSQFVVNELPIEQVFLGFEVGESVLTGGNVGAEDMLGKAMRDWGTETGRSSWDPMTVLLAFGDKFPNTFAFVKGQARVDEQGLNYFEEREDGKHAYVKKVHPDSYYQELINSFLK